MKHLSTSYKAAQALCCTVFFKDNLYFTNFAFDKEFQTFSSQLKCLHIQSSLYLDIGNITTLNDQRDY